MTARLEEMLETGWEVDRPGDVNAAPVALSLLGEARRPEIGPAAAQEQDDSALVQLSPLAVEAVGAVLTAGSVMWMLRAGGLATSLISTVPAWKHVDLLAVIPDDPAEAEAWAWDADEEAQRDEEAFGGWIDDLSRDIE